MLSGLAGALSAYLFHLLENEQRLQSHLLLELPVGESFVSLHHSGSQPGCFGSISYSLVPDRGQTAISAQAWLALSVEGKEQIFEGSCSLFFNALGQFGTSLCKTEINGNELRFGTTHIDPITLQVYLGRESTTPIVQQNFPGPVTLASDGRLYSVRAPFGSRVTVPSFAELQSFTQLPQIATKAEACDRRSRSALEIPISTLRTIHQRATNLIPKGLL